MTRFRLALGLHNHQPIGNFDSVFESAHRDAYAPFLDLLQQHPTIRLSLHQSGILWRWQQQHYPDYLSTVRELVRSRQLELLTGGFYEPILPAIPERDALGQIALLTTYLKETFGEVMAGLWLTERVWEPHLPKLLHSAGVRFLPVDDTHFRYAGLELEQLSGPFVTESEGYPITLLPIQKKLRYLIPFGNVEEVMTELRRQADKQPDGLAVYADDGEKFGVWPHTHRHCYTDRWLARFFEALARQQDWLEVVPLSEAAALPSVGQVWLPTASYEEMLHWSLPTPAFIEYERFEKSLKERGDWERFGRFVRGGHWRGFLAKYPEANLLHKKMLRVSNRLHEVSSGSAHLSGDLDVAREHLYAGQCNCPYWHGVFGGLYLPHLRKAVYGELIKAEALLHRLDRNESTCIDCLDVDADGHDDIIVTSPALSAWLSPKRGGMLVDISLFDSGIAPLDTLSRRREGYHEKLTVTAHQTAHGTASIHDLVQSKEPNLERFLAEDTYLRRALIEHLLPPDFTQPEWMQANRGHIVTLAHRTAGATVDQSAGTVRFTMDGISMPSGQYRVTKTVRFDQASPAMDVEYLVEGTGGPIRLAIENNFTYQAGHAHDRFVLIDGNRPTDAHLDSAGTERGRRSFGMIDEWQDAALALVSDRPAEIWRQPIFTVSLSEGGFERVYQGTTVLFVYDLGDFRQPVSLRLRLVFGRKAEIAALLTTPLATVW